MIDEAPIKTTVEELRKLIHISNYIGEPIESEDKILIPVSKAAVGFGIPSGQASSAFQWLLRCLCLCWHQTSHTIH